MKELEGVHANNINSGVILAFQPQYVYRFLNPFSDWVKTGAYSRNVVIYDPDKLDTLKCLKVQDRRTVRTCNKLLLDEILFACLKLNYITESVINQRNRVNHQNEEDEESDENDTNENNDTKFTFERRKTLSWILGDWHNCCIMRRFKTLQLTQPQSTDKEIGQNILQYMSFFSHMVPVIFYKLFFLAFFLL